jgi:carbamoyltransferase
LLILGLNYSLDSAASLLGDGRILAAAAEERFDRVKHTRAFPSGALNYCLSSQGIDDIRDVDAVAFFWNAGQHLEHFDIRRSTQWRHHSEFLTAVPNHLLNLIPGGRQARSVAYTKQEFAFGPGGRGKSSLDIYYLDHHLCHAASCFLVSPFEEAAILTMDGYGERTSVLMAHGRGTTITPLKRIEFPHSLGAFYAALTQYLGYRANCDEGKVMALAALGSPTYAEKMRKLFRLADDGTFEADLSYFSYYQQGHRRYSGRFEEAFGPERSPEEELTQRHYDVAAAGQIALEEVALHLGRWLRRQAGCRRVCLAGGVALNCVANSRLLAESGFEDMFVLPAAGDDGTSLGAALYLHHGILGKPRDFVLEHPYWGPEHSGEEIESLLRASKVQYRDLGKKLPDTVAGLLSDGRFVGWFQGRMEIGPRALGARSILADPRPEGVKERLNFEVKHREAFRPYAPAVLEERCGDYFEPDTPSPFMLRVQKVRPGKAKAIPGVVHVDGTARAQTVGKSTAPLFRRTIEAFERRTGVPMVLNTSLNVRGEPMVCTPRDALRCFYSTGLDALAIGPFLVQK